MSNYLSKQEILNITKNLIADSPDSQLMLDELQKNLSDVIVNQVSDIIQPGFVFEQADDFNISEEKVKNLKIAKSKIKTDNDEEMPDFTVFLREAPLRSSQIKNSTSKANLGSRISKTLGPFKDFKGKEIFFDFIKVEKLIPLYFDGDAQPALLFKASFLKKKFIIGKSVPELSKTYKVNPNSIWINARFLKSGIAANLYVGLRIKGGTITLDQLPVNKNNQITLPVNTNINVKLDLDQKEIDGNQTSAYGIDAKKASLQLPTTFEFSFNKTLSTITTISEIKWNVFGSDYNYSYQNSQSLVHQTQLNRLCIPVNCNQTAFTINEFLSPWVALQESAPVKSAYWALHLAEININSPLEADGNGAIVMVCKNGLKCSWKNLTNDLLYFKSAIILGEPGRINITSSSNGKGAKQTFKSWLDQQNIIGTSLDIFYLNNALFNFNTVSTGDEVLLTLGDTRYHIDRPVKVNAEPVELKSKNTLLLIAANDHRKNLVAYDDNLLQDFPKNPNDTKDDSLALALHNALFTVTKPNSYALLGYLDENFEKIAYGNFYMVFGLYSYLPTLPDPYAANLGILSAQFPDRKSSETGIKKQVRQLLVSRIQWKPNAIDDSVGVSFHFAPLPQSSRKVADNPTGMFGNIKGNTSSSEKEKTSNLLSVSDHSATTTFATASRVNLGSFEDFSLLDVSSKANQMGIAFTAFNQNNNRLLGNFLNDKRSDNPIPAGRQIIAVEGLDVVTQGKFARAFTVPQVAWEPIFNFTPPEPTPNTPPGQDPFSDDPPAGFNYYPNDGIATRIGNLSSENVSLSPLPMAKFLVDQYRDKTDGKTYAFFNLPFGMLAFAILDNNSNQTKKPSIKNIKPEFQKYIHGGIQLELTAGKSFKDGDDDLFQGLTFQLINVLDAAGDLINPSNPAYSTIGASTLGSSVEFIFNHEFSDKAINPADPSRPAVPLKRIGLSGYGANSFSDWRNTKAAFAETSQALFNITTGRTSREVVQVKSVIYPWAIRVVRTVTIFRMNNGFVGRIDSGWKAESEGLYDFTYYEKTVDSGGQVILTEHPSPYEIHPGLVKGLYNIKNIRENELSYGETGTTLRGLTFDADVLLENVTDGGKNDFVPSKAVLGFVQLAPRGVPISVSAFKNLIIAQSDAIGGPINCTIKLAGTSQYMKLSRFDFSNSETETASPVFAAAAKGSVNLPKDGSWTMVSHQSANGTVTPIAENTAIPVIRIGRYLKGIPVNPNDLKNLVRIANPSELLREAKANTINFGLLQNMGTQKVLYLTPAFKNGVNSLLSKTPPLLADSFRLLNTKGIFPDIGKGLGDDIGAAIKLLNGVDKNGLPVPAFNQLINGSTVKDGLNDVFEILKTDVKKEGEKLLDQGYELLKNKAGDVIDKAFKFDLPSFEYPIVDITGLKIYIEYKAKSNPKKAPKDYIGKFDFNVESFAGDMAEQWKGRLNNLAMVVDLGPMERLMTIKGNFNAQKGQDVDFGSKKASENADSNLPTPEIEFSDAIKPVIQILEILAALSTKDYGDALKKGLKIAMSNSGNIWEYKFEATKDIPLVKFPPGPAYDAPQTPLKLEASMGLGVYFNAALKVTTDPTQLLPTAGAFFKFHAGLQVMCVSVGAGTIYAVGNADLKLSADTSPLIALAMKFGFGAQIAVGLPVIGNVSILFMVGVEIYVDSNQTVIVTAFMLFRGHAEILGGIVGITITIEAKGSIEKQAGENKPAICKAQITFALDISIFLVINISFSESWEEQRQIA